MLQILRKTDRTAASAGSKGKRRGTRRGKRRQNLGRATRTLRPAATHRHRALWLFAWVLVSPFLLSGCGSDFSFSVGVPPAPAAPLAATYDIMAAYPSLHFPEFSASGLTLDMTLEIDPNSAGDPSGLIDGTVTIHEASVGGIPRSFTPATPIPVSGRLASNQIDLQAFGPVRIGQTAVYPALTGTISPDGRRIDGVAFLGNFPDQGSWFGVKQRRYLVAGTDYSLFGSVSIVTVRFDTRFDVQNDVEATSGDPISASSLGSAFIVNRLFFDNVQILDPAKGFTASAQFSTENGSNPHDVLVSGPSRLYVTRYEAPFNDVAIADLSTTPPSIVDSIDLAPFSSNASGTPRADRLVRIGSLIMVTLQNIDEAFTDYGPGRVAFIDPVRDVVVRAITLDGQNPFGPPSIHPQTGEIYLATAGIFQGSLSRELTGGVEVIDPATLSTRGLLVDDDDLGGNVSGVAVTSSSRGYAVVVTASGSNRLMAFDPATGAIQGTILSSSSFIPEIRYDGDGYLLVTEHDIADPRLRIIDAATGGTVARLPLSRPPVSLAILTRDLLPAP